MLTIWNDMDLLEIYSNARLCWSDRCISERTRVVETGKGLTSTVYLLNGCVVRVFISDRTQGLVETNKPDYALEARSSCGGNQLYDLSTTSVEELCGALDLWFENECLFRPKTEADVKSRIISLLENNDVDKEVLAGLVMDVCESRYEPFRKRSFDIEANVEKPNVYVDDYGVSSTFPETIMDVGIDSRNSPLG